MSSTSHADLVQLATRWVFSQDYAIVVNEMPGLRGERPDVLAWKFPAGDSCLVECKVTRQDLLADKKKPYLEDYDRLGGVRWMLVGPDIEPAGVPKLVSTTWGIARSPDGKTAEIIREPKPAVQGKESICQERRFLLNVIRRLQKAPMAEQSSVRSAAVNGQIEAWLSSCRQVLTSTPEARYPLKMVTKIAGRHPWKSESEARKRLLSALTAGDLPGCEVDIQSIPILCWAGPAESDEE